MGVFVARRLESRGERERTTRAQEIDSYRNLISQFFRVREALRRVALAELGSDEIEALVEEARVIGVDWNNAVFGVWLDGDSSIAEHVRKLDFKVNALFVDAESYDYSLGEWYEARYEVQRLMDAYLDRVRVELDLPPHKIVSDYKR